MNYGAQLQRLALSLLTVLMVASCASSKADKADASAGITSTTTTSVFAGDPLLGRGDPEVVASGLGFLEGPQWIPSDGVLLFTQVPDASAAATRQPGTILRLTPEAKIATFRDTDTTAGLALDPQHRLIAAEQVTHNRVTRTDGSVSTVADAFEGKPFNQPNDLVARSDGTIYFTDPHFGPGPTTLDFHGVFRIAPEGIVTAERRGSFVEQPNGIALSPDQHTLYVDDTVLMTIFAYDVAADGSLSNRRELAHTDGYADGMAIDRAGNLFVAVIGQGVEAFGPDGHKWGLIPLPNPGMDGHQPTNCAFGGADAHTLFITANGVLYRVHLQHPGVY